MGKIGLVFGGQGSQYESIGRVLYEKYEEIRYIYNYLGDDLKKLSFYGSLDEISKTKNLQPIILAFQLSVLQLLRKKDFKYEATCGLSLGEYASLVAGGIIGIKESIELIKQRGLLMDRESKKIDSSMLAVLRISLKELENLLECDRLKNKIYIANINSSKQIVLSGESFYIKKVKDILKDKGYPSKMLKVTGAFHTPFMNQAKKEFIKDLKAIDYKSPKKEYYPNLIGEKYKDEDLVQILSEQMVAPVLLYKTFKNMIDDGVDKFIEIGPGRVLSSIIEKEFDGVYVESLKNDKEVIEYIEREYNE